MRLIKFRGKPIGGGQFIYGNLSYREENGREYYAIQEQNFEGREYEVDPETVGQFTGLFDKNGKEIWEGDKLRISSCATATVVWRNEGFDILDTCSYTPTSKGNIEGCVYSPGNKMEVYGSIHDNPELLKTE